MKRLAIMAALTAVFAAGPAFAAEPWGIEHERTVVLTGKVTDLLCALKGDCPADCGAGRRQLGLLAEDGKLYAAVKSSADFAGATIDLAPMCGRRIEVDGLVIDNPAIRLLMVQNLRERASDPWVPAKRFLEVWTARNGAAEEWFRADPLVKETIAADGVLGIRGLEPKK